MLDVALNLEEWGRRPRLVDAPQEVHSARNKLAEEALD
jgi:hypothetical protein